MCAILPRSRACLYISITAMRVRPHWYILLKKCLTRLTNENVSKTIASGAISMPMLRIVSAQNPASSRDAKRQVIYSGVAS